MEFKIKGCIGALMMGCVFAACEDDTDKGGSDVDQPKEATYLLYMVGAERFETVSECQHQ